MNPCPCGTNLEYPACCGLYHNLLAIPTTPEALMRSRYCAYALGNMHYIKKTMRGKPLIGFNEMETTQWAKSIVWLELKIIKTSQATEDSGVVEFVASFLENHFIQYIHEISQFHKIEGYWFYTEGKQITKLPTKISRNTACPCGSHKKFKNCHQNIHR